MPPEFKNRGIGGLVRRKFYNIDPPLKIDEKIDENPLSLQARVTLAMVVIIVSLNGTMLKTVRIPLHHVHSSPVLPGTTYSVMAPPGV